MVSKKMVKPFLIEALKQINSFTTLIMVLRNLMNRSVDLWKKDDGNVHKIDSPNLIIKGKSQLVKEGIRDYIHNHLARK